jgi:hypothetical protein
MDAIEEAKEDHRAARNNLLGLIIFIVRGIYEVAKKQSRKVRKKSSAK